MLPAVITPRLAKLIPVLSSDQPGEVIATAAAIGRVLSGAGANWHDLAAQVAAPWRTKRATTQGEVDARAMLTALGRITDLLSSWEFKFCDSLHGQMKAGRRLSAKQRAKLAEIWAAHHA
ncbi:MAG: hypothetical protein WD673_15250 [Alphaproteobacteria bacterium]